MQKVGYTAHLAVMTLMLWLLGGELAAADDKSQGSPGKVEDLDPGESKLFEGSGKFRGAETVAILDGAKKLRLFTTSGKASTEERFKAEDPGVKALLRFMGLPDATSFIVMADQNPKCSKKCDLMGGEFICTKVCN